MVTRIIRFLNALHVFVICGVLLASYGVQFLLNEQPCPLCMLQRLSMIGIAMALFCNARFGIVPLHYGIGLLSCLLGAGISMRQMALHIYPQVPSFGTTIFGLELYWWAFIVFSTSLFVIAVELCFIQYHSSLDKVKKFNWFECAVFSLLAMIIFANVLTTLVECGLTSCLG